MEVGQHSRIGSHGPRARSMVEAECSQCAGGLTDIPFHRMQPVTAVRDVSDAKALSGRQHVVEPLRQQGTQRDLERVGRDVEIPPTGRARVEINPVTANPDRVREGLGAIGAGSSLHSNMGFQHGEFSGDAAAFSNVSRRCQAIGGAERLWA